MRRDAQRAAVGEVLRPCHGVAPVPFGRVALTEARGQLAQHVVRRGAPGGVLGVVRAVPGQAAGHFLVQGPGCVDGARRELQACRVVQRQHEVRVTPGQVSAPRPQDVLRHLPGQVVLSDPLGEEHDRGRPLHDRRAVALDEPQEGPHRAGERQYRAELTRTEPGEYQIVRGGEEFDVGCAPQPLLQNRRRPREVPPGSERRGVVQHPPLVPSIVRAHRASPRRQDSCGIRSPVATRLEEIRRPVSRSRPRSRR